MVDVGEYAASAASGYLWESRGSLAFKYEIVPCAEKCEGMGMLARETPALQ